jgi:hypothetical protein
MVPEEDAALSATLKVFRVVFFHFFLRSFTLFISLSPLSLRVIHDPPAHFLCSLVSFLLALFSLFQDEIVPAAQMVALHGAATSDSHKEMFVVPEGRHNDTWQRAGPEYLRRLRRFLETYAGPNGSSSADSARSALSSTALHTRIIALPLRNATLSHVNCQSYLSTA